MEKYALCWTKVGKKEDSCCILKVLPLVLDEPDTVVVWITNGTIYLWNFDTFETEKGRKAHLEGKIAEALMANAEHYFLKIL
jgi:hypothetical protein